MTRKASLGLLIAAILVTSSLSLPQTISDKTQECRNEKYRPQLHFSPKANWVNDPNGLVYYDGEYHLFYQYTPDSPFNGPKYWGHAVSTDLVTWTELDIALSPDEQGDMWSGSAVVDYQNVTGFQQDPKVHPLVAFFTHAAGPKPQQQSIAYSMDKGRTFTKYPANPVIPNPGMPDFRDPKVVKYDDETWVVAIASGDRIRFYSSTDLKNWELTSEFGAEPRQGSHGGLWECPDLLRMNYEGYETWVLLVSNEGNPNGGGPATQYFVGSFDGTTFRSDQMEEQWIDVGFDNYASVAFSNEPKGRANVIGWMSNWRYAGDLPTGDFKGQMTLPRILSLAVVDGHLRLRSEVAEEFHALRIPEQLFLSKSMQDIAPNAVLKLSEEIPFKNPLLEVNLAFNIHAIKGPSSIAICFLNSLDQELCVGYDHERPVDHEIFLNREKTGDLGAISGSFQGRSTAGRKTKDQIITFSIVLDIAAVELFVDGGLTVMTSVFYPDEPLTRIEIRHHAGSEESRESRVTLISGSVQGLRSIYDC